MLPEATTVSSRRSRTVVRPVGNSTGSGGGGGFSEEVQYYDCHWIDELLKNPCREGFLPSASEGGGFVVEGVVSVTTDAALEEVREWNQSSEV
jgi:hypothetical protein